MGLGDTRSAADSGASRSREVSAEPHLFLVLACDRVAAPPLRVALGDLDEVVLGRGGERSLQRRDGVRRALDLRIDDAFMSTTHARLVAALDGWYLEDAGSKNGSLVNGARVDRRHLADGDVLELGHTLFVYRAAMVAWSGDVEPTLATQLPALARSFAAFATVAASDVAVTLHGEVGTGKERMARALHRLSRRTGAFVAINCGALPPTLVESELFGHRRGAFTGALEDRVGLVRSADGGTLFLDEIGELPAAVQVALLRVLQEREVVPVGATRPIAVDLRVVAATHRDLGAMVAAGTFRADLLSRIGGFTLTLPPLRARREDLGLLVAALLARAAAPSPALTPNAARCLLAHRWPGNIRELEKCLATAAVLAGGATIAREHLPASVRDAPEAPAPAPAPAGEAAPTLADLTTLLRAHHGNVSAVARALGKAPVQVRRWLKRHGLSADDFRG